ncbi:MAG: GNAT family N-acetyltransferase [Oligoflexales bacterium]
MIIEQLKQQNLHEYCELQLAIDSTSSFMDYDADERIDTLQDLLNSRFKNGNSIFLVAKQSNRLVGYGEIHGMKTKKKKHVCWALGGFIPCFQSQGFGSKMLSSILDHAAKKWRRLDVTVMDGNIKSVKLLKSFGFQEEGKRHKAIHHDGKYYDEIYLGIDLKKWRQGRVSKSTTKSIR